MIEICENWSELVSWCWDKGIYVDKNGINTRLTLSIPNYNKYNLPFKEITITEQNTYFDDVCSDLDLTITEKSLLLNVFLEKTRQ